MKGPDITRLKWQDYPANPVISPPFPEWIMADPVVLVPNESPDSRWHLFAHSLRGIHHYHSPDGFAWVKRPGLISGFSYRPYVYRESGLFYLIYEKLTPPFRFPHYNSRLEVITSPDLVRWSDPEVLASPSLSWHRTSNKAGNLGNACLLKIGKTYRLYYSAGLAYMPDTGFCEPRFTGIAVSGSIFGPYEFSPRPQSDLLTADTATSALRVYRHGSGYISLQTVFSFTPKLLSSSAIRIALSPDGLKWKFVGPSIINPDRPWKQTHVYVGDLKRFGNQYRIYYNARNSRTLGAESIGVAVAAC